jgi:hypothetical protein
MKIVFVALLCLAVSAGVNAQDKKDAPAPGAAQQPDPNAGKFRFEEDTHDFGEIMEGPSAECDFEFRNVGKTPIIITQAKGSCGCTVPKWPTEPILPKHKGKIHVTFNTQGRVGPINKDIIITSNAQQNPMKLHITGYVKPAAENAIRQVSPPPAVPPAQPIK